MISITAADIIELGVPFSDPIADGPAIQETNTVCLAYNVILGMLREARSQGLKAPVLLMGMLYQSLYIPF